MKKLYSSVTGIDRGTVPMFSDFESDGEMWASEGDREKRLPVLFSEPFKSEPTVFVTLEMLDLHNETNYRVMTTAENVNNTGFDLVFQTWGDTRVARANCAWMAIGEVYADDDWDIDCSS